MVAVSDFAPRLLDIHKLMKYTSLGEHSARELGKEAGALLIRGKSYLYDRVKIDAYIDKCFQEQI